MRKSAIALALAFVASLGVIVPSVSAAAGDPKVVIIVGATHGSTASYRNRADVAYAEARKYTSNVVKVYSPNATWSKVKAAVVNASVVIYMGHGNGWPSPYTFDPQLHDQGRLRAQRHGRRGRLQQQVLRRAVHREPGPRAGRDRPAPPPVLRLGQLRAGPRRAERRRPRASVPTTTPRASSRPAHRRSSPTGTPGPRATCGRCSRPTSRSRTCGGRMPNQNGNVVTFPSMRTPGVAVFQDPETPTSGFYRSLAIGTVGVTTGEVMSAGYGDTGADPTALSVPGNAAVSTEGAGLYSGTDTTAPPAANLPAGTRLRVVDQPNQVSADGDPLVQVEGIDDPSIGGFMVATDLAPRDSSAPVVRALEPGGPFSPNGDGQVDTHHDQRPLHRNRRLDPPGARQRRRPGVRDDRQRLHVLDRLERAGRWRSGPGRHLRREHQRRSMAGTTRRPTPRAPFGSIPRHRRSRP